MDNLIEIVDSLETRIVKILERNSKLSKINSEMEKELIVLRTEQLKSQAEIDSWSQKCTSLRIANSILGSDEHKRETKLKINALIREIDTCISQLSE